MRVDTSNSAPFHTTLINRSFESQEHLKCKNETKIQERKTCFQASKTNQPNDLNRYKCHHGYLPISRCTMILAPIATSAKQARSSVRPYFTTSTFNARQRANNGKTLKSYLILISACTALLASRSSAQFDSTDATGGSDAQASRYRLASYSQQAMPSVSTVSNARSNQQQSQSTSVNSAVVPPQVWARSGLESGNNQYQDPSEQSVSNGNRRVSGGLTLNKIASSSSNNMMKSVRHIVTGGQAAQRTDAAPNDANPSATNNDDMCADRLCYGLPIGCASSSITSYGQSDQQVSGGSSPACSVLVTSKRHIDPERPVSRDIIFEMIALPSAETGTYAAVGFSENGRMQGLASECLHYREEKTQLEMIKLKHSYNLPGAYSNVPVSIISGIRELGNGFENGRYSCRWIVESAVEYSYEAANGSLITRRDDLGYRNYHILLASGDYNDLSEAKGPHTLRSSSLVPVSLAQTGHIKSLGAHILIRIHGSLMIAIWIGFVTLSIVLARYYKNEWANSKLSDLAVWFVVHRALMLAAWFGTMIAIIFAYMYTETYHPGLHQLSGTTCLVLTTIQVLGGLFRPSQESSKRSYFNWAHFVCGNLSYLCAMICLVTAAFLAPAHLPPMYIWVIVIFVATYALAHAMLTTHQYITHKSSKISITPMSDLNSNSSTTYTSGGFVADSYPKEVNSPFRQFLLGILVTIIVIFIVLLISLVNIK